MSRAEENTNLSVEIISVNKTVRGSEISLRAIATGEKSNVNLIWRLPIGFEILNGEPEVFCETLACEANLTVLVRNTTSIGPLNVGVEAKYV